MQFQVLGTRDELLKIFENQPGHRYMKFYTTSDCMIMDRYAPTILQLLNENEKLCGEYLQQKSSICCKYVCSSHNILMNLGCVTEQQMHCDYRYEAFGN